MGIKARVTTPRVGSESIGDPAEASLDDLKAKAKDLNIPGRSKMSEEELVAAIAEHSDAEHR